MGGGQAGNAAANLSDGPDQTEGRHADGEARSAPRIVLAIDQGEELFLAEGAAEADAFLRLVRDLVTDPASNLIVVFTIRSDAFERLQTAPAMEGLGLNALSLPPLPRGAYQTVIEGPAARLAETRRPLKIEPALTAALLADVEAGGAKDALPLLAFTLERLYLEHGGDGDLRRAKYEATGGIKGSIEAAVEGALKAADADPAVPRDRAARLALLRRAMIPWLAGIDPETGSPRRRVARLSEIPAEARPLVDHLIAARLLATDVSTATGETTVEPAHEALLRQWGLLQGWLKEDFAALSALEGVKRAARDWAANGRDEAWLAHTGGRLDDAEALLKRDDLAASLDAADRTYLAAARAADTARRDRELEEARKLAEAQKEAAEQQRKVASRTRMGLVAATLLLVIAAIAAAYGFYQAKLAADKATEAQQQADIARKQTALADAQRSEAEREKRIAERNFAAALAAYQENLDIARRAAARDPHNADALLDLSVSVNKLGDVKLQAGDGAGALAAYQEGLAISRKLAAQDPGNAQAQRDVSIDLNKLGDVRLRAGDGAGALAAYQESLDILRKLAAQDPGNAQAQTDVMVSLTKVASVADDPAPLYREALAILQKLDGENRLTADQKGWIGLVKDWIAALPTGGEAATK